MPNSSHSIAILAQNALGLFDARQLKAAVHRTHHQIKPLQYGIRQIEAAILEDVDLDALEQGDAAQLIIETVNLVTLSRSLSGFVF